jgi:mono/diheme cytochrome c family protein
MNRSQCEVLFALLLSVTGAACSKSPTPSSTLHSDAGQVASQDDQVFETRCFVCHGRGGRGDGPASSGLGTPPRDFTNQAWQASTSDDRIRTVIRNGAESVGGSTAMPPNPDLTDVQIEALVHFVRSLKEK